MIGVLFIFLWIGLSSLLIIYSVEFVDFHDTYYLITTIISVIFALLTAFAFFEVIATYLVIKEGVIVKTTLTKQLIKDNVHKNIILWQIIAGIALFVLIISPMISI